MNLSKFQSGMANMLFGDYGDSQFEVIRTFCGGMSGLKTAKLLNFAVSCLSDEELYFEIGVLTGYTMISAGLGNRSRIIGVDNFSDFGNMREKLAKNLLQFYHPAYQFIESDFRKIGIDEKNKKKIGVLYIDGKHDYQEVLDSFAWAENGLLADKSLIFLDDISVDGVSEAINEWLKSHKDYETIFSIKPFSDKQTGLWSHDTSIGLGLTVLKKETVNV